jgi:hypothetical protein
MFSARRPSYLNPFEGRKKPIHLSGLFLFDPDVAMRLQGRSLRTTFIEMGEESFYKGLERAAQLGRATQSLKDRLIDSLPGATGKALAAAFDAPDLSANAFAQMGPWEAHLLGALCNEDGEKTTWPPSAQFLCDVERAGRHATALFDKGQFQNAAEYVAKHSLLQHFMSPEVLHGLAQPLQPYDRLTLRIVVALEVWLSLLALWDMEARPDDIDDEHSYILPLFGNEDEQDKSKNTAARLFDWLLKAAKVSSLAALQNDPRLNAFSIQAGTLGAWSRGTNFPSSSYASGIAKALLSAADASTFKILSAGARQLNFLGYIAQHVEALVRPLEGASAELAKQLGISLPFGHATIEGWMRTRYVFWLQFHRPSIAVAPAAAEATEGSL